jgi:hypothetical protein
MRTISKLLLSGLLLTACQNNKPIGFSGVDPDLTVPATQVMVLGTAHLSQNKDKLTLDDLEPLMARLGTYAPDIITIENSSGMTCQRVRAYPREHAGYADAYCFDGTPYRAESGLTIADASFLARKTLLNWPDAATASQRRKLAAAFLASNESVSATVQWLQLHETDRVIGDGLGQESIAFLKRSSEDINESYSIAARLAARLGLEQVHYADDHGSYYESDGEREAYGARLNELWSKDNETCLARSELSNEKLTGGDILEGYRFMNTPDYGLKQMDCDWKRTMNDDAPEQYGRKYTLGWQARNLRMVSMIVTAATHKPGGKVVSIVGASHKPYFEAYLDQMHDIEVVSTDEILK